MLRGVQSLVRQPAPLDLVEEWLEPLRMLVQDADGSRHITSGSPSISATRTETGIFHPLGQLSQQSRARRSLEAAVRLAESEAGRSVSAQVLGLQFINGLTLAALLFLLASGFTLIFGLMRIMNLSHGGRYLVGGYLGLTVIRATGNFFLAALVAAIGVMLLGILTERFLMRPIRGLVMPEVLLSIGLAFILGDLSLAIWGGDPQTLKTPDFLSGSLTVFGSTYPMFRFVVLFVGAVVGVSLWYLQERTRIGAIVRAGVDDREMVDAVGINVKAVFALVFAFGALLAGLAGVMGGAFLALYPGAD